MMLDDYREGQPVAYNVLSNVICNNNIAHAYLFESDNATLAANIAFSFAKTILCPNHHKNRKEASECHVCQRLDNNNFPEFRTIEPDGLWIKKEQLMDLQEGFRLKAVEGEKRVYIINGADKLNAQAANSMLKFLEEPEPNIIALLTTSDIHSVLPTIISRCQVITLKCQAMNIKNFDSVSNKTLLKIGTLFCKNDLDLANFIDDAKNVTKIDAIVNFVKKYEALKVDVLLESKKLWHDYFVNKEDFIWALDLMSYFYKDAINAMCKRDLEIFDYYCDTIDFVISLNTLEMLLNKIKKILLIKEKIKYNTNLNLLLDKLVLDMESEAHV